VTVITDDPAEQTRLVHHLLAHPEIFPHDGGDIVHLETHISHLLLVGEYAYKIKKPLDLGFLDFSSLEKRRRCCEAELRLNRRLAPALYLEVVSLYGSPGQASFQAGGEVLEYAVRMRRFRQQDLLSQRLPSREEIDSLADLVADFHQQIPHLDLALPYGTPAVVLQPMEENFQQIRDLKQPLLEAERLNRLQAWTEEFEAVSGDLLLERRLCGQIRECHGDLHLDNITRYEGRLMPFDGIEFNPALRWIDTLSDLAFLLMDLQHRDLSGQAAQLLNAYLEQTGDYHGLPLLRFYQLYRAMVRAKVNAIRFSQPDLDRQAATGILEDYRRYLSLAESLTRHPPAALLITHGLSGSGKSHISGWLAERMMAIRIRSDVERRRLFPDIQGVAENPARYTSHASQLTYAHLAGMAKRLLQAGFCVIVDATFLQQAQRQRFSDLAAEMQTPLLILDCQASEQRLRERVRQRAEQGGDASQADLQVLALQQQSQQPLTPEETAHVMDIDSEGFPPTGLLAAVLQRLMR
jgi:uncharacterized protein